MTNLSRQTGLMALLVLGCAVFYFLVSAQYLYEWDSVNYALGAERYDLAADQPHAPGYPLWILLMRLVMMSGVGPNAAQILLANLFSVGGLAFLFVLARSWFSARAALFAVVISCTSPPVGLYSAVALNYPVDLFASCVLAYLAFRLARGDHRLAPAALGLLALLAGIRPSGSLLLSPLVLVYFLSACRRRPGWLAGSLATAGVLGAAWLVPLVHAAGGWTEYQALCRSQTADAFTLTSVFFGAGWKQQLTCAVKALFFLGVGLGVPVAINLMLLFSRRGRNPASLPAGDGPRPWAFFLLWLTPAFLFALLLHAPKPGYILVLLPGLGLAAALWAERFLGDSAVRTTLALAMVTVVNLTLLLLPYDSLLTGRFEPLGRRLSHCTLASVRHADLTMDLALQTIRESDASAQCSYVVAFGGRFGTDYRGPNWRKLAYYLPRHRVGYVDRESLESGPAGVRPVTGFDLPTCTTRIWWVVENETVRESILYEFPGTRERWHQGGVSLLESPLPEDFAGRILYWRGCAVSLSR